MNRKLAGGLTCLVVAALFAACGGGGSTSNPTTPSAPAATAPTITTQPVNAAGTVGSTVTFTVVASGTDPLSYQWQRSRAAIAGATAASYTTPALQIGDDGAMFDVVVTNSAGTVTSGNAKLSVTAQPSSGPSAADVVTFKNDALRSGQYLRFETTLDANGFPNQGDYGNSFVKVSSSGPNRVVADYFATFDEVHLSAQDLDLGSGGEMLLPDLMDSTNTVKHLVVGAGKDGKIYLVDRDNMGKFNSTRNNIWQQVDGALGGGIHSSPAYFNGNLYYGPIGGTLKAFSITSAKISTTATSQSIGSFGYPGTSPVVCASGTANAIVWAHENGASGAVLHAYNAANLATELYNSTQATGNRDQFGAGNKFITPTVAGGKVFVGTTNSVGIFGLLH